MKRLFALSFGIVLACCTTVYSQTPKSQDEPSEGLLEVYIPTAFTPNMDGHNDYFRPVISGGELDYYEFTIIDRRGKVIFNSDEPTDVWTGTTPGSSYTTSPSIFLYYLKVKSASSIEYQVFTGHVVMVR